MPARLLSTTLDFDGQRLRILDQRLLPQEERWLEITSVEHMVELIQALAIRGAPLIGVSAALALAQFAHQHSDDTRLIRKAAKALREARPTAVNLAAAIDRMISENPSCNAQGLQNTAMTLFDEDVTMCTALAKHGAELLADGDGVLTICNSGALATAGIGTALGVIINAAQRGRKIHVYACETRPLLQGARLTTWELARAQVPYSLICDSMAASLMAEGRIQKVMVGADRIARNGDVANKIGTYALAVLARHHGIPFYAVAPSSTVDERCPDGAGIPIEQRAAAEVHGVHGRFGNVSWVTDTTPVVNPAFDVTPRQLVTGIVLEHGMMAEPEKRIVHDRRSLISLLTSIRRACQILGDDPDQWTTQELGDGNVNMLFKVTGTSGSLMVKQAVPYLRCVGASWPLSVERVRFEAMALSEYHRFAPEYLPEVIHFDPASSSLVMEFLQPHTILRKGLVAGIVYPKLAEHLADYLSRVLVSTSDIAMSSQERRRLMGSFIGNTELCQITEDLVFTDPYRKAPLNRWTTPDLDDIAMRLRSDKEAKTAISELKRRFLSSAEALIHGDFHTGSIMTTLESTKVIDPEFAFFGPIGFDTGLLVGNLLLAYFSQFGHESFEGERAQYQLWILQLIRDTWNGFCDHLHCRYLESQSGERISAGVFSREERSSLVPRLAGDDLDRIFSDTLGFAAAEMIRRILGLAHVEDFEAIPDTQLRAACERRALTLARDLLVHRAHYQEIDDVLARAAVVGLSSQDRVKSHG